MTPIDVLKSQSKRLEQHKKAVEIEIEATDKRKDELVEEFKSLGLQLIELKTAIKKLEEK